MSAAIGRASTLTIRDATVGRNIVANLGGTVWVALLSLAVTPLYVRWMGVEAYGLVGFFAALVASLQLFDVGLSPTLNREMARQAAIGNGFDEARDLVRTIEAAYWIVGIVLGIAIALLAPYVASHWVHAQHLRSDEVVRAVALMGSVAALQWPVSFYSGGLQGLQKQTLLNAVTASAATLRFGGSVIVLLFIAPTVTAFFIWQATASAVYSIALAVALWSQLPGSRRPRFHFEQVRRIGRFAAGMSGIGATVIVLSQIDKLIVSRLVTLELFGYYALGWVVASGLVMFITPFFNAVFPHLTALVARGDTASIAGTYHRGTQLVATVILPVAAVIIFFAPEVLYVWTGDHSIAAHTSTIVRFLVAGAALNALMNIPYALQLAYGWTSLPLAINVVSIIICVPLILLLASRYGVAGAASVWTLLNLGYCTIGLQLIHRRLLRGEQWRWYVRDVGLPAVVCIALVTAARFLITGGNRFETLTYLAVIYLTAAMATIFAVSALEHGQARFAFRKLFSPEQP